MASHRKREVAAVLLFLIGFVVDSVQARRTPIFSDGSTDVEFAKPPRGTIKTFQSGDEGDIVDCVDIYKQPALDHPLLKNHTIQMRPSWFLEEEEDGNHRQWSQGQLGLGDRSVDCPEGTIPIIRKTSKDVPDIKDPSYIERFNESTGNAFSATPGHEYAQVSLIATEGTYHGARSTHNVWTPFTEKGEISISQVWIIAGPTESLNTVEAGWIVWHDTEPKLVTRLFVYWTNDGYQSTGCYNLECPGFVQTHKGFGPGAVLKPVSSYNGKQYYMPIEIKQDLSTGNWWLRAQDVDLGYWPGTLFTNLRNGARTISWGGEIVNSENNDRHTTTQMGSGHLPREGYYMKSAYIKNIGHIQGSGPMQPTPIGDLTPYVTKSQCYDLVKGPSGLSFGTHFYFGGPGLSDQCP